MRSSGAASRRFSRETSGQSASNVDRNARHALGTAKIDDSGARRKTRAMLQTPFKLATPSRREMMLRSVKTL